MAYIENAEVCAQRASSANDIADMLDKVVAQAASVLENTQSKLDSFMLAEPPTPAKEQIGKAITSMPPYFDSLRQKIESLQRSIDSINNCIRRTDI